MKSFLCILLLFVLLKCPAQVNKINLQATGLTCSMCSNAINKALKSLDFIAVVEPDIKSSSFEVIVKPNQSIDFEKIRKKVVAAGYGIAQFFITMHVNKLALNSDSIITVGDYHFQFIGKLPMSAEGDIVLRIVDKGYVTPAEFKKKSLWKNLQFDNDNPTTTIYHVMLQ